MEKDELGEPLEKSLLEALRLFALQKISSQLLISRHLLLK